MVFLLLGGLSIDAGNAWKTRNMLQATADASALAGVIELSLADDDAARNEAIRIADLNLNENVLLAADVATGAWNNTTRSFDPAAAIKDAVQVTTRRTTASGNPLPTFLLKLTGLNSWDVATRATAQKFLPNCIRDGMVARGRVEISSNNAFVQKICIHGQEGVKISSNNTFDAGVTVSMPDMEDLQLPASGLATNAGLARALREDWLDPKIVDHIDEIIAALRDPASSRQPGYIDPTRSILTFTGKTFKSSTMSAGRVHSVNCTGNQSISIDDGAVLRNVVLVTNCRISFSGGASVSNAILATSNTGVNSIGGNQGVKLGIDDNCRADGGAQLVTAGSMHFASGMEVYGSQLIARDDIMIAAQANGIEGTSFQSGGDIKVTSNGAFGICTGHVDQALFENYFRLVG